MRVVVKLGFLRRRGHPETECMLGEPVVLVLIVCVRAGTGGASTRRPGVRELKAGTSTKSSHGLVKSSASNDDDHQAPAHAVFLNAREQQ